MKTLLPVGYFPPISYFAYLRAGEIIIERHEHFVKQSLRSRCTLMGANGPLNLLVPRLRNDERQTMSETIIDYETNWRKLHWRSLESAYRKSPYFEYYEDQFEAFYRQQFKHHLELGVASIELACRLLKLPIEIQFTVTYDKKFDGLDLRNAWNKQSYVEKAPVDEFPTYIQVFEDRHAFEADLSILDLLFCEGPQAISYLQTLKMNLI